MHLNQPLDQTKVPGVYARCPPSPAGSCSSCQKPIPNKQKQNGIVLHVICTNNLKGTH